MLKTQNQSQQQKLDHVFQLCNKAPDNLFPNYVNQSQLWDRDLMVYLAKDSGKQSKKT